MIPTVDYIKQKFDEYNNLIFEGKLPELPFKLSDARTFLGQITCMREKNTDGTWHYCGFVFRINTKIDLPEEVVQDTIIHEMIHYYIMSNQMQDSGPHGQLFIQKMQEINIRYNRNISVSHKATNEEHDKDTEIRQHFICVSRQKNGQRGITIATKSKIFQVWDQMVSIPGVAEIKWVISTNPYFNRYPRCTTAKIYRISQDELDNYLSDAQELIRTGNNIRIKNKI